MTASEYVYWIPLLPLAGAAVNGVVGRRLPRALVSLVACLGPLAALALAVMAFLEIRGLSPVEVIRSPDWDRDWIRVGLLQIPLAFSFDRLAAVMCLVVTGVGSLIHVYSIGYMGKDPGYARFFAYLNLFMAAMLVLVLAGNLVLLFLGWEGVGLCSYLLIGFWFDDAANARAGKKAFVVNRIGDFGFLLGMLLLASALLSSNRASGAAVDLTWAQLEGSTGSLSSGLLTAAALLLFVGAAGKSAQIPLYVWLPDAMAGPTPVSALIHAATMVTSGIYLLARLHFLYAAAPLALAVVALIGVLTASIAGFIALTQFDIKKVLAYSTVSQLGFMFLAAGLGAYSIAIFHLVTHAFFKGLLFLGAGAVIHALHHEQDMRRMGGLRSRLPVTFLTMLAGAAAIAGLPLTSGFFSKDAILNAAMARAFTDFPSAGSVLWIFIWLLGLAAAVMTSFYIFRLVALTFLGKPRSGAGAEIHEAPGVMLAPLVVLALLSLLGGFIDVPRFLDPASEPAHGLREYAGEVIGALAFALGALGVWYFYIKAPEQRAAWTEGKPLCRRLATLSSAKLYVDEIYDWLVVRPLGIFAHLLYILVDRVLIDWILVSGSGLLARGAGALLRRLQTGRVPTYAAWFIAGAVALLAAILMAGD